LEKEPYVITIDIMKLHVIRPRYRRGEVNPRHKRTMAK